MICFDMSEAARFTSHASGTTFSYISLMLSAIKADITAITADAIVNAANTSLLGGGGVDGAIHRKGGPKILEECMQIRNKQGGCPVGQAVITTGGNLPSKYVIHTVGPVWNGGNKNENELLASAYQNSLKLAEENNLSKIAFPNISTGIYGFPKKPAAEIAVKTVKEFMESAKKVKDVIFVCFDEENLTLYKQLLK
jgi:O-acetyl-ADP-ribose deacetylase (regulator of RNase III)